MIPADAGFDPAKEFRLQLLVQRAVGPVDKAFLTFDLGYLLPERFLETETPVASADGGSDAAADSAIASESALTDRERADALWQRIWQGRQG